MNPLQQILFVDDDELILNCYERLLSRHFTIVTALGSAKAIEALNHARYAVVASDLRMPGMDGLELLRRTKKSFPETVCLLLTGNPNLVEEEDSLPGGILFRVVSKPCPTSELVEAIAAALEQYRQNVEVVVH